MLIHQLGSRTWLLPALLAVFVTVCRAQAVWDSMDQVPMTSSDSNGTYVETLSGRKWYVFYDQNYNMVFFRDTHAEVSQWEDPRTTLTEEEVMNVSPEVLKELHVNLTKAWGSKAKLPGAPRFTVHNILVAVVPLLLFSGALGGRIWYLKTHHPDLLQPSKDRKNRVNHGRIKPQKARGKWSQDGKGGRSANS